MTGANHRIAVAAEQDRTTECGSFTSISTFRCLYCHFWLFFCGFMTFEMILHQPLLSFAPDGPAPSYGIPHEGLFIPQAVSVVSPVCVTVRCTSYMQTCLNRLAIRFSQQIMIQKYNSL